MDEPKKVTLKERLVDRSFIEKMIRASNILLIIAILALIAAILSIMFLIVGKKEQFARQVILNLFWQKTARSLKE